MLFFFSSWTCCISQSAGVFSSHCMEIQSELHPVAVLLWLFACSGLTPNSHPKNCLINIVLLSSGIFYWCLMERLHHCDPGTRNGSLKCQKCAWLLHKFEYTLCKYHLTDYRRHDKNKCTQTLYFNTCVYLLLSAVSNNANRTWQAALRSPITKQWKISLA